MANQRRGRTTAGFVRFLRAITLPTLLPVGVALVELGPRVGVPLATALALVTMGTLLYGVGPRVQFGFQDRVRPRVVTGLLVPLFDTFWCGALLSPITTGLVVLGAIGWSVRRPPFPSLGLLTQIGCSVALVLAAYGVFVRRHWVRVRRIEVPIDGLPLALDGYRIAHLSDLHVGSMARLETAQRWVRMANALDPDLIAVTGDLLSTGSAFHDEVVASLGELRARDGVFGCLGNHDYYDEGTLCDRLGERGVTMLRNRGTTIERKGATLHVAGVEDLWRSKADLPAALEGRKDGTATLLLAHHPDYFTTACDAGVSLMLAGHIHAGQFALPFFARRINLGKLSTPYAAGLFRKGNAHLFVSAGLGTTGPAIRLGAAPEIVELTLRRV